MNLRSGRETIHSEHQHVCDPRLELLNDAMKTEISTALVRTLLGIDDEEELPDAATVETTIRAKMMSQQPTTSQPSREREAWASLRIALPTYQGYADGKTPSEFLAQLTRFANSQGMTHAELLARAVPVALTDAALRWWSFVGGFTEWDTFKEALQREFGAVNYRELLKRELDSRTQHPAEPLSAFIQIIASYYDKINEEVTEEEKIERVIRQMHPEFRREIGGRNFANLQEMAKAAPDIQKNILIDRQYRPPPPAAWSIEPTLAWKNPAKLPATSDMVAIVDYAPEPQHNYHQLQAAALDPYLCHHVPAWASYQHASTARGNEGQQRDRMVCWLCKSKDHFARNCTLRGKGAPNKYNEEAKN
jgi:hypothetical protein